MATWPGGVDDESQRELSYRIRFAEAFSTEEELCTAVQSFESWTAVRESLKKSKDLPIPPALAALMQAVISGVSRGATVTIGM
jgi:hypothetical protein